MRVVTWTCYVLSPKLTINSIVKVPVPVPMLFLNVAITVSFC